jgi:hypothetical protein
MVNVLFSPGWFYGIDAIFESIAILATILLSFYSYKLYKFTKKSSHKYFSLSFFMISLAFFVKVITNLFLYFPNLREKVVGFIISRYYLLEQTNFIYALGNFGFRFLMLLGLLGIFWIIGKSREKNKLLILLYFVSAISLVSIFSVTTIFGVIHLYILFHLTAALFLAYITYFYYTNYLNRKKKTTFYIFLSFLLIFLSQLVFIFLPLDLRIYVIAEFLQLAGYFLLLYEYYMLVRRR